MKHKNTFKLQAYACLAASYLVGNTEINAQAVYYDYYPNLIIDDNFELVYLDLDLDLDGNQDFHFGIYDYIHYATFPSFSYQHKNFINAQALIIAPDDTFGIACTSHYGGTSYGGGKSTFRYYPIPFERGAIIDSKLAFNNSGERMAFRKELSNGFVDDKLGLWYPEVKNHFLGVAFKDAEDPTCIHYGWIRCSVQDTVKGLVIKDYAYETRCGVPIAAGDKVGDTSIIAGINNLPLASYHIYTSNNIVVINLPFLQADASIHIYNTTGQEVYASITKNNHTTIPLDVSAGIYLVEVISGENRVSKKVVIN